MPHDPHGRTVRAEAWVNGRPSEIAVVAHRDQVTILAAGGIRIEIEASVFRWLAMRVLIRMALVTDKFPRP